ncbi:MAG: YitT family protein [Clostridia bacterium]|nr:YitT family protein [Clostridia bacterium]
MQPTNTKTTETAVSDNKNSVKVLATDILVCLIAAILVSSSLYYFSNYNHFAPGGVTGFASIVGSLIAGKGVGDVTLNMSILMFAFNLPIFILVAVFTQRKTGVILIIYLIFQSGLLMLFKYLHTEFGLSYYAAFPSDDMYVEGNNVVFAAIGVGVISGFGFSIMLRRFGASGGTYAISALIKHFKPEKNIAWLAFVLDSSVVILAFFVYGASVNSVISTLTNIFISDLVVDFMLQGLRSGYKFEIITEKPDELAKELMIKLHRGVTMLHAEGMYTHSDKSLLICIVRKREIGTFLKLLKKHGATFSYSCRVNEVYGRFAINPFEKH